LSAFVSNYTPILLLILFFVFALTMAGDDKRDAQPQASKTKLDTIVSHLDAMKTLITGLKKEVDAVDLHGHARCVSIRGGNDSFSTLPFTIPPYNGKYDPAAYLDWELEVEQHFSCHDIPASAQVRTAISAFTAVALFWWHHEYKQKHPTTWAELKAAMRRRFVPSYYACKAEYEVQGRRSTINTNHLVGYSSTPSSAAASPVLAMVTPPPEALHIPLISVNSEIKSDNPVLLATRANFDDLCDAQLPCYALACSSVLISLESAPSLDIPSVATNSFAGQSPTSSADPTLPVPSMPSTTPREGTTTPAAPWTTGGAPLTDGETTSAVLNFSTTNAIIEQLLVDPILDFSLSCDALLDVPCDKDDLSDNSSVVHVLKSHTCAEVKHVIHIANSTDERQLQCSIHTLDYIEFDILCNLDCLEEQLFKYADLPCFLRHTYHAIGKYNNKGQYMICRVYICENLNYPFVVQNFDPPEGSYTININACCSSDIFTQQVYSQEGEHCWLLPMPASSFVRTNPVQYSVDKHRVSSDQEAYMTMKDHTFVTWKHGDISPNNNFDFLCFRNPVLYCVVQERFQVQSTPRTAFRQEGEDDADMATILMSMRGACIGEDGVQQGFPSQEGGPRLIRFESPRWRPKAI
jgi:hypothetical protein